MSDHPSRPYDFSDAEFVSAYDELPLWSALIGGVLLDHVPLRPDARVLDVGTGTGFPLIELAARLGPTCRACGIDRWKPACERARQKIRLHGIENVEIIDGDAAAMPFADERFNLIVSNNGINNFENAATVLAECRRVCAPDGTIALASNLRGHMHEFYDIFAEVLREQADARVLERLDAHILHRTSIEDMRRLLEDAGFAVVKEHLASISLRYLDGSALLRHFFVRQAFLDGWRKIIEPASQSQILTRLEERLNDLSRQRGEFRLTVPVAYIEGRKRG